MPPKTSQLTRTPANLPQLTVTTPTTAYSSSAGSEPSTPPSRFGANPTAPALPRLAPSATAHGRVHSPVVVARMRHIESPVLAARAWNDPTARRNGTRDEASDADAPVLDEDALPRYVQVYLTPHPDNDGQGDAKEKSKWSDIEATLPAHKADYPFGPPATAAPKRRRRRCAPRPVWLAAIVLLCLIVPLAVFTVAFTLQHRNKPVPAPVPVDNATTPTPTPTQTQHESAGGPVVGPMVVEGEQTIPAATSTGPIVPTVAPPPPVGAGGGGEAAWKGDSDV